MNIGTAFILSLLLLPCGLLAQVSPLSPQQLKAAEYSNKAEIAICRNNLSQAEKYYDSLFRVQPVPSGKDIWNRALLAKQMHNKSLTDSLTKMLFFKGCPLNKLAKCFDTTALSPLITPYYTQKSKEYKRIFDSMLSNDQRVNRNKEENPEEWIRVWIQNAKDVMALAKKAEQEQPSFFSVQYSIPGVVLLHYFQLSQLKKADEKFFDDKPHFKRLQDIEFDEIGFLPFLADQVAKGNYDRVSLFYLVMIPSGDQPYASVIQYDSNVLVKEPDSMRVSLLDSINSLGAPWGMDTYQNYFVRARYADSLLTEGHPFQPISMDKYLLLYEENNNNCTFDFKYSHRLMRFFRKPDDGERLEKTRMKYFKRN